MDTKNTNSPTPQKETGQKKDAKLDRKTRLSNALRKNLSRRKKADKKPDKK